MSPTLFQGDVVSTQPVSLTSTFGTVLHYLLGFLQSRFIWMPSSGLHICPSSWLHITLFSHMVPSIHQVPMVTVTSTKKTVTSHLNQLPVTVMALLHNHHHCSLFMPPTSLKAPWGRKSSILLHSSLAPSQVPGIKWHLVNIYGMGLQWRRKMWCTSKDSYSSSAWMSSWSGSSSERDEDMGLTWEPWVSGAWKQDTLCEKKRYSLWKTGTLKEVVTISGHGKAKGIHWWGPCNRDIDQELEVHH